jgi:hypothetical protein
MGGLVPGIAGELFGRNPSQRGPELGLGLGSWRGEQGDLVATLGQPVGQQRHYPLDAAAADTTHSTPPQPLGGTRYQGER